MKLSIYTLIALLAFAANSLLCRMALQSEAIDPGSFTLIRLLSGASILLVISLLMLKQDKQQNSLLGKGEWLSAIALFIYAAGFSFAYISLPTGLGALLLFGSVQITMMSISLVSGERLSALQWLGFSAAIIGLVYLLFPDTQVDELSISWLASSAMMTLAGIAWGIYSIRGKLATNATLATGDNFVRASLIAAILFVFYYLLGGKLTISKQGLLLAVSSGAITSGLGYAIWYSVLPQLKGTSAASLQLTVPVFASIAGALFLQEIIGLQLILASLLILGGVAVVIKYK